MGSEKKGILLLSDLTGKRYKHGLYNKLLGVDTLGVQVGLQHLSFQI